MAILTFFLLCLIFLGVVYRKGFVRMVWDERSDSGTYVVLLLPLLTTTSQPQDQVQSRLLLDVVVRESSTIFELLAGEDQSLLIRRDSFLVLDLGLDVVDGVRGLDLEGDGLAREATQRVSIGSGEVCRGDLRLDENLHLDDGGSFCPTNGVLEREDVNHGQRRERPPVRT
jgi:hypothetical protein